MIQALDHQTYLIDTGLYGPLHAACYLVQDGDELALIDTGTFNSIPKVMALIEEIGATPEQMRWIMPTHVHLDHAGGAGGLMEACPNAQLVVHPKGAQHMIDPSKLTAGATAVYGEEAFLRDFGVLKPIAEERVIAAEDGQAFALGGRELQFVHTPGHANHHGCIFDSQSRFIFTGDTFGLGYTEFRNSSGPLIVATTTPVAFDPEGWFESLEKIKALQPSSACLTHFGEIKNPLDYLDMLASSVQAHVDIALAEEPNENKGRGERLKQAVEALLVGAATAHCDISADEARKIFASDIDLNSQGLYIWLVRRAKKRAQ